MPSDYGPDYDGSGDVGPWHEDDIGPIGPNGPTVQQEHIMNQLHSQWIAEYQQRIRDESIEEWMQHLANEELAEEANLEERDCEPPY